MGQVVTKVCTKCSKTKPIEDFHWKIKPVKKTAQCGDCLNISTRKHYRDNKDKYKDKTVKNNLRYIYRARVFIRELKLGNGCTRCEESHPDVLEFDHVNPKTKRVEISYMTHHAYSIDSILEEIEKCVLLCANCHRKKTSLQKDWYNFKQKKEKSWVEQ